jgi:thiamine-monophosphate kinase
MSKSFKKKTQRLSNLREFGLINHLRTRCAHTLPAILKGIGDDAAAVKIKTNKTLVTTDMMLEGIHFDCSYTTLNQLGHKILAVNMSDIFSMGGSPLYFLLSIGLPRTYTSAAVDELYSGILKTAKKFGIVVIGGDTSVSRRGLVLCGTLIGEARRIVTRSGARAGDSIYVTGTLGDSALGLMLLKKMRKKMRQRAHRYKTYRIGNTTLPAKDVLSLLRRHLTPEPVQLKKTAKVTSMIDISDGLLIDLSHICDESKVGALIHADKIPLSRELNKTARQLGLDPLTCALKGGEDYALLFTGPQELQKDATKIGEVINKGRFIVDANGKKTSFRPEGYEHFR